MAREYPWDHSRQMQIADLGAEELTRVVRCANCFEPIADGELCDSSRPVAEQTCSCPCHATCGDCDCADPLAMDWRETGCECDCHGRA